MAAASVGQRCDDGKVDRDYVKEECTEYSCDDDDDDDTVREMSRDQFTHSPSVTGHRDRAFSTDYKLNVHVGSSGDIPNCAMTDTPWHCMRSE